MKPFVIALSLLANAALLLTLIVRPALVPPALKHFFRDDSRSPPEAVRSAAQGNPAPHATADPRSIFSSVLATEDLTALIAQLRAAGFPNAAIRTVIEALLNERYAARLRALSPLDPDAPFWKPIPYGGRSQRAGEELQLLAERSRVMRELLGNFATNDSGELTPERRRQYGSLPQAKIDRLERINADYAEMNRAAKVAMNGITLPEDREKLALLEREKRADLAALLSPQELEEYEMRNSPITERLRPALALFPVTADEFRTIYKIQQAFADRIGLPATLGGMSSEERNVFMQQRPIAQAEHDAQMRSALGEQRYAEFTRASDRDYQQLLRLTERANLPAQSALQAWTIREQTTEQTKRIFTDAGLSADQKVAALQALAPTTRAHVSTALGATAGEAYAKTATWITTIDRYAAATRARAATAPTTPSPNQ